MRRRRTARVVSAIAVVLIGMMLAATAFSAQLAPRQAEIDRLDRELRDARELHGVQRRLRAELRAPGRLVAEAQAVGMRPADATEFVTLPPDIIAVVQQSTGSTELETSTGDEFERVGEVKRIDADPSEPGEVAP